MKHHLNTLFVTTQGTYLRKVGQAVSVQIEKKEKLRIPLHNLGSIICFGRIAASPSLLGYCAELNVAVAFLTEYGRFLYAIQGYHPGNVLLRREQFRRADDLSASADIAKNLLTGKLLNARTVLRRAARETDCAERQSKLTSAANRFTQSIDALQKANNLDTLRGIEGEAANLYFQAFPAMINSQHDAFTFLGRNRRPPTDPVNALLSFLYAMLAQDCRAAAQAVGLDAAVGFLHRDRPGRPGLALDLMEEFRHGLTDRLVLSLINRQQIKPADFITEQTGAIRLTDDARKIVLTTYQKRKQETITHPFLNEKTSIGLLPHLQARLLARYLRNELDAYPPFLWK